jgi:hypothetical protein
MALRPEPKKIGSFAPIRNAAIAFAAGFGLALVIMIASPYTFFSSLTQWTFALGIAFGLGLAVYFLTKMPKAKRNFG